MHVWNENCDVTEISLKVSIIDAIVDTPRETPNT